MHVQGSVKQGHSCVWTHTSAQHLCRSVESSRKIRPCFTDHSAAYQSVSVRGRRPLAEPVCQCSGSCAHIQGPIALHAAISAWVSSMHPLLPSCCNHMAPFSFCCAEGPSQGCEGRADSAEGSRPRRHPGCPEQTAISPDGCLSAVYLSQLKPSLGSALIMSLLNMLVPPRHATSAVLMNACTVAC